MKVRTTTATTGRTKRDAVWIGVDLGRGELWFKLSNETLTERSADIIHDAIVEALHRRVECIRRDAYRLGWSDRGQRRSEQPKRTEFNGFFNDDEVGW